MARYVIIRWFGISTLDVVVEVVVLKRYQRPLSMGRAPPPPVSRLAVPVIVDRGAESSGASVNGTFRARVRRAVRRPGKCEESDNQETGLCVVTLRASKWLPTTIYRRSRYTFTDTVRERDTVEEGIGWNEIKLGLSSGRAIRRCWNGGGLRGEEGKGQGRGVKERKRLPWRARSPRSRTRQGGGMIEPEEDEVQGK